MWLSLFRSSPPEVFCKKGVLRNFTKFKGKDLCQSFFNNKVTGPATLLKKRLLQRCFPANFEKFLKTPFFIEHLCWLFLSFYQSGKLPASLNDLRPRFLFCTPENFWFSVLRRCTNGTLG